MARPTRLPKITLTERKLQEEIVRLLKLFARPNVCWWACPNGDLRHPVVGGRLKAQGVQPGASDLMFIVGGIFHGLELKTEIGTMSDSQTAFQLWLESAGGVYHVAYGLDEALAVLTDMDVFKPNVHLTKPSQRLKTLAELNLG